MAGYHQELSTCFPCEEGKYSAKRGSKICSACPNGTFADFPAATKCQDCIANSSSPQGSVGKANCSCNIGFTANISSSVASECILCEAGKFKSAVGSAPCAVCPAGTFSYGSSRDICIQCPPNSYSMAGSNAQSNCTCLPGYFGEYTGCQSCPAGKFKSMLGPGNCSNCSGKPEFAIYTGVAAVSHNCSWVCLPGYLNVMGICNACQTTLPANSQFLNNGDCTFGCSAGFFFNTTLNECELCPVGKFSGINSTSCQNCSNGPNSAQYVGSSAGSSGANCPWICNVGYYQTLAGKESPRPLSYTVCTANLSSAAVFTESSGVICYPSPCATAVACFYPNNANVSTIIAPGKDTSVINLTFTRFDVETNHDFLYVESCSDVTCTNRTMLSQLSSPDSSAIWLPPVQSSWTGVLRLTFTSDAQIAWTGFSAYWQSSFKVSTCERCSNAPIHAEFTSDGGVNSNNCSWSCMAGFQQDDMQCLDCVAGKFKSAPGSLPCSLCAAGTYSNFSGASTCSHCGVNSYSSSGSVLCSCNAGFSGLNPSNCVPCLTGTYKMVNGTSFCLPCISGTFNNLSGSSTCFQCPNNSFSPKNSVSLTNCTCNKGYTGGIAGNNSVFFYWIKCVACRAGTYKSYGGAGNCNECAEGTYSASTMATICIKCPAESVSNNGSIDISNCSCQPGFSASVALNCFLGACSPGEFKNNIGFSPCMKCPNSSYSNSSASTICFDCPVGSYSGAGATACFPCTNSVNNAQFYTNGKWSDSCMWKCKLGSSLRGGICESCPTTENAYFIPDEVYSWASSSVIFCRQSCNAGFFFLANASESNSSGTCVSCGPNTTSPDESTDEKNCSCLPGFIRSFSSNGMLNCTACAPGSYRSSNDTDDECIMCRENTYAPLYAMSLCVSCPSGTTGPRGSITSGSCVCNAGYSGSALQSSLCSQCSPGKYKAEPGPYLCLGCNAGSYSQFSASSTCFQCPVNAWSAPNSTSPDNCSCNGGFFAINTSCVACDAGKYKMVSGSSACVPCLSGQFSISGSSSCIFCQKGKYSSTTSVTCIPCPPNSYSAIGSNIPSNCSCNLGYFGQNGTVCEPCKAGSFSPNEGAVYCSACPSNSYSQIVAATACLSCPLGSFSFPGSSDVVNCSCNVGYFGFNGGKCTVCSVGKYTNKNGSSICLPCREGLYNNFTGASICLMCPEGSSSANGSTNIKNCSCMAGHFGVDGSQCQLCESGKFKNTSGSAQCIQCPVSKTSSPDRKSCVDEPCADLNKSCNAGYFLSPQPIVPLFVEECPKDPYVLCSPCPTNMYSPPNSQNISACECNQGFTNFVGQFVCAACEAGTYKSMSGSSPCIACQSGKYSSSKASITCTGCPENSTSQGSSSSIINCTCNKGYFASSSLLCMGCPPGKYKPIIGTISCFLCPEGYFSPNKYSTACLQCPSNTTSIEGSNSIQNCTCDIGYFQTGTQCLQCSTGNYKAVVGSFQCLQCPAGTFSDSKGSSVCFLCPENSISIGGSFSLQNCSCNAGYTTNLSLNLIKSKSQNATFCVPCKSGKFSSNMSRNCSLCNAGFYSLSAFSVCVICSAGKYSSYAGSSSCISCVSGTYSTGTGINSNTSCTKCPPGSSSVSGSFSIQNCSCNAGYAQIIQSNCTPCVIGKYRPTNGSACLNCPAAKYSKSTGSTFCIPCPSNSSSPISSVAILNCTCNAGFVSSNGGNCLQCPSGKYSSKLGSSVCLTCAPGQYSVESFSLCTECPPGTYSNQSSSSSCVPCKKGYFSAAVGSTSDSSCTLCPSGSETLIDGCNSTDCCLCSPGFTRDFTGIIITQYLMAVYIPAPNFSFIRYTFQISNDSLSFQVAPNVQQESINLV